MYTITVYNTAQNISGNTQWIDSLFLAHPE